MLSDEWLSRYGLLENFNASVTRTGTGTGTGTHTGTGTWTTGVTAIALCTSCSRANKNTCGLKTYIVMPYRPDIPVGAVVELRHSKDDWTVTPHYDDEMPRFVRQYCIQNQATGEKKRVFLHEIFEKNTTTYQELQAFFRQQTTSQPANEPANEPTDQVRDLNRIAKKSRRKPFVNNWPVSVVSLRVQN